MSVSSFRSGRFANLPVRRPAHLRPSRRRQRAPVCALVTTWAWTFWALVSPCLLVAGAGCSEVEASRLILDDGSRLERDPLAPAECGAPYLPIASLQGSGASTPYRGEEVTTEGVVVGSFQGSSRLGGFFLQDPVGDGDPETSEGLFVFEGDGGGAAQGRSEGDWVRVTGTAVEYYGRTQLDQIRRIAVCGRGPVPTTVLDSFPFGVARLEAHEGMRVRFEQPLTVIDSWALGTYGELLLAPGGRVHRSSGALDPAQLLLLDDGSERRDPRPVPHLSTATTIRLGDQVSGLEGVLSFAYGSYRLQPIRAPEFDGVNPRPPAPARPPTPARPDILRVATLNLENYFVDLGLRGAATAEELVVRRSKLARAIVGLAPDVAGLVELQNDDGAAGEDLLAALAAELGESTYRLAPVPRLAGDEIRVTLLYAADRVEPLGLPIHSGDPVHVRPPVAQTFTWGARRLTVAVAHLKSRRCTGARGVDLDQQDGQGCFNDLRRREARRLLAFLRVAQQRAGDSALVLVGDLNAYPGEAPLGVLEEGGLKQLLLSPRLQKPGRPEPYSYVFDGQAGLIDHVLSTPAVEERLVGGGVWHINADEPAVLRELAVSGDRPAEVQNPHRASDHDPVYVDIEVPLEAECVGAPSSAPVSGPDVR